MQKVSDSFLKIYKKNFLIDHSLPFAIQYPSKGNSRGWKYIRDKPLSDPILREHLEGKYWVALTAKTFTKWVCFDVDTHESSLKSAKARVQQIRTAFPSEDPLIFSSPNGGFHVYFLLAKAEYLDRTNAFVNRVLKSQNIKLQSGMVEVFPSRKALRAPIGRQTLLLESNSLKPVFQERWLCLCKLNVLLRSPSAIRKMVIP